MSRPCREVFCPEGEKKNGRPFQETATNGFRCKQVYRTPAGLGFSGSNFAIWTFSARPILLSSQMP
jgi:hypothetical protein